MQQLSGPLHELLDIAATRWPDRRAISCGTSALSYRELDAASRRLAAWLEGMGLRHGQRVVIHAPASLATPALLYACSRIGAVFSVVHEQVRGQSLLDILDDCEPALVVEAVAQVGTVIEARGTRVVDPQLVEGIALGAEPAGPVATAGPAGGDLVCLIYTSGTTSEPKAVVSTHDQLAFAVQAIQSVLGYRPDDIVLNLLPLSFDYGLYQLFLAAAAGACVRLGGPAQAGPALLDTVHRSGATVFPAVPMLADTLVRLLARSRSGPPALRMVTNTGAELAQLTVHQLRSLIPDLTVHVMFGLTECKRAAIMPANGDLERPGSCGRALPGTELLVVDGAGKPLPPRTLGEIVVRGPNVMAGYWRRPELTAVRFHRVDDLRTELRTGDYGWLDDEGYLYFDGRRDDIYKVSGFRVSALEVEAAARRVAGVTAAAVLVPTPKAPALLFVTGTTGSADVLAALRTHIEDYKIPGRCIAVAELPLTRHGKVDRVALAAIGEGDGHV